LIMAVLPHRSSLKTREDCQKRGGTRDEVETLRRLRPLLGRPERLLLTL
jgi:hypothetical protein